MNLRKRMISIGLSVPITLLFSGSLPDANDSAAYPWNPAAPRPNLTARPSLIPGTTYFNNREWTGETVGGVRQSDVFQVNREVPHTANLIVYDNVEKAITGAVN
jgi:hypothetical protein